MVRDYLTEMRERVKNEFFTIQTKFPIPPFNPFIGLAVFCAVFLLGLCGLEPLEYHPGDFLWVELLCLHCLLWQET